MFKDNRSKRFRTLTNYGTTKALKDKYGKAVRDARGKIVPIPAHKFQRTVLFTGTPRPQSSMNLWSQLYILDHGERLHKKFDTFRTRFFTPTARINKHDRDYEEKKDEVYTMREGAPERIHELIADITVELNAVEMGLLPPITPVFHYVEMPPDIKARYDILERDALIELKENPIIAVNGGVKTMLCWQFANGAIYNTMVDAKGQRTWEVVHDLLLDELQEVLEELDQNVIIPYQFIHDYHRISEKIPTAIKMPAKAEAVVNKWNAGNIKELLIHPKSCSHGLNLQYGGYNVLWFGCLWSNEQFRQTLRRLARPGQPHFTVYSHHIMVKGTVHELQYASLMEKGNSEANFRKALDTYQKAKELGMYTHEFYGQAVL